MLGLLRFAGRHFEQIVDHPHLKDRMRQNVASIVEMAGIDRPRRKARLAR